jgi:hypothetical protein
LGAESYELVIQGTLSPVMTSALTGFDFDRREHGRTRLVGCLADQAQLHRVLGVLVDLNIRLVSLNQIPGDQPTAS